MNDLVTSYGLMRNGVGAVWLGREVIRAQGPDVVSFLQGQLSQDVTSISVDASAWSWILQPHGKVDALVRLTRTGEQTFLIDVDRRYGAPVIERLERFKLRTDVTFELLDWKVLGLRGPEAHNVDISGTKANADWNGVLGVDVFGPDIESPLELCDLNAYEAIRIESGFPQMGSELDEKTIPAEADINNLTISFNKGCYTGQELVARIDSRGGNVPRHLRFVTIDSEVPPLLGSRILPAGRISPTTKPLGQITSAAYSPGLGKSVALAFIRRDAFVPLAAQVDSDDELFNAHIDKVPFVP